MPISNRYPFADGPFTLIENGRLLSIDRIGAIVDIWNRVEFLSKRSEVKAAGMGDFDLPCYLD